MELDNVTKAMAAAALAHGMAGQKRRWTGEPYVVHPTRVMHRLERAGYSGDMLVAALLHDVVEDTVVTLDDVNREYGLGVSVLVGQLTAPPRDEFETRGQWRAAMLGKLADACGLAQTIKCADIADNCRDVMTHDPEYGLIYRKEKLAVLAVLTRADPELKAEALGIVMGDDL